MKVTNRLRESVDLKIDGKKHVNVRDFSFGSSYSVGPEYGDCYVSAWGRRGRIDRAGPFPSGSDVLIVSLDPPLVCDWTKTLAALKGLAVTVTGREDGIAPGAQAAVDVSSIVIGALVTGIAAIGEKVAFPAGALFGLGNLLLWAYAPKEDPPPEPPTLGEISDAVRSIVREELDMQAAEEAVTSFLLVAHRLQEMAGYSWDQVHGEGVGPGLPDLSPHDRADFMRRIESIEGDTDNTRLNWHLEHFRRNPQIAKFALSAYIAGIGAGLQARRLHLLARLLEPQDAPRLTAGDVSRFIAYAESQRAALENAFEAFKEYRDGLMAEHSLTYSVPEGGEAASLINRMYTGSSGLRFAPDALDDLKNVIELLRQDQGALSADLPTRFLWRETWRYGLATDHGGWETLPYKGALVNECGLFLADGRTIILLVDGRPGQTFELPFTDGEKVVGLASERGRLKVEYREKTQPANTRRYYDPQSSLFDMDVDESGAAPQRFVQFGGSDRQRVARDSKDRVYLQSGRDWVRLGLWARYVGPPGLFLGTDEVAGGFPILRRAGDGTIRRLPGGATQIGGTFRNPVIINAAGTVYRLRDAA